MVDAASDIQSGIRQQRSTVITGSMLLFLAVAIAPRNERALFATLPFGVMPSAFAAVPEPSEVSFPGQGGLGGLVGGAPGGVGGPYGDAPIGGPGAAGPGSVPTGDQLASAGGLPDLAGGPVAAVPGADGTLPGGGVGGPEGTLPGGAAGEPGAGGGGGGDGLPGFPGGGSGGVLPGVPGGGVGPDIPAVPEPASWLMMIGGTLLIGSALRQFSRGRRRSNADNLESLKLGQ